MLNESLSILHIFSLFCLFPAEELKPKLRQTEALAVSATRGDRKLLDFKLVVCDLAPKVP